MTPTRRRHLLASLTGVLALVGLLSACAVGPGSGGNSSDHSVSEPQQAAPDAGGPYDETAPDEQAAGDGSAVERAVVTTTSAYLTVTDVPGAISALASLVDEYGGYIEARDESLDGSRPSAYLTTRIPADRHDEYVAALGEFGEVTSLQSSAEDVTLTKVDLESRISSLESSIASLESMLEATDNVTELLEVEEQLSARQAELQSLESQLEVLDEDVAMSTVTVNFSTEYVTPDDTGSFWDGLTKGWHDFVQSTARFVEGLGYALPGLVLLAAIVALLWFAVFRRLVRRMRDTGSAGGRRSRGGRGPGLGDTRRPAGAPTADPTPNPGPAAPDPQAKASDGEAPNPASEAPGPR